MLNYMTNQLSCWNANSMENNENIRTSTNSNNCEDKTANEEDSSRIISMKIEAQNNTAEKSKYQHPLLFVEKVDNTDLLNVKKNDVNNVGKEELSLSAVNEANHKQTQALSGIQSFEKFIYSTVNKISKTVMDTGGKIKKTFEENTIFNDFNQEQEVFLKSRKEPIAAALPPWSGCLYEEAVKDQCLNLSTDRRNFVRCPPTGVDFQFDYNVSYPIAIAVMNEDPKIEKMRFDIVPKLVKEETFWKNYFYRVSLICKANEYFPDPQFNKEIKNVDRNLQEKEKSLQVLEVQHDDVTNIAGESKCHNQDWEKELENELLQFEIIHENAAPTPKFHRNFDNEMKEILSETDFLNNV